jgi:hypothetical protein
LKTPFDFDVLPISLEFLNSDISFLSYDNDLTDSRYPLKILLLRSFLSRVVRADVQTFELAARHEAGQQLLLMVGMFGTINAKSAFWYQLILQLDIDVIPRTP